ncbi:MAG: hypothetical protein AAB500_00805 [Patescibacteria group bacterium]
MRESLQPTNKEADLLSKYKELKENIHNLEEGYNFEMEKEAKANLWNQLEKAKKEYRKLEEELDNINSKKAEIEDLKDVKEEKKKQEKEEEPDDKKEEKGKKEFHVPERLLAVDVSDIAEQLAKQRATERVNEVLSRKGVVSFFKKLWYRPAEEFYRRRYYAQELARIKGEENIFADPEKKAEHEREMRAEFERFQEDLFRATGGESKKTLEDPEFNKAIIDLMREYALGKMADEEFTKKKHEILRKVNEKHPDSFGPGHLSADNFLEAAREFRKLAEHGEGLARLDAGLAVDLGNAKRVVKTEQNLGFIDKIIERTQKHRVLAHLFSPTGLAAGLSVAAYFAKKPVYFLGGALGAGALFGALRRSKDIKVDVATHRMERAMGRDISEFENKKGKRKNREAMERFVYDMRLASEIKDRLIELSNQARMGNPEALRQLIEETADAEARMSISETDGLDLIEYEGEKVLSQSRLELMRILAETKVQIKDLAAFQTSLAERMAVLNEGIGGVNKELGKFRAKEMGKAAVVGGIIGAGIGAVVQEGLDKTGIHPRNGGETSIQRLWHYFRGERSGQEVPTDLSHAYAPLHNDLATIRAPQGTEIIENTNGTSSLVDSRTHEVLVKEIIQGKDGKILNLSVEQLGLSLEHHGTKIPAGSIEEYLQANRHSYAEQLQEIHRHAHLMNETTRPDLNELRLHYGGVNSTGFDEQGHPAIDLSNLKQFESFQGSRHPDIATLMSEGKIKLLFTPDTGNQHEGIVIEMGADGKPIIPESLYSLFGKDASGRLTHPGFLEAVIADEDGKYTPIATDVGQKFTPGLIEKHEYTFHRVVDRDWELPSFIPIFPRKALEDYKGTGEAKGFGRKTFEEKAKEWSKESDVLPPQPIPPGKYKEKASIASRSQTLEGEEDLGERYPAEHVFPEPREIAERMIRSPFTVWLREDLEKINAAPSAREAADYVEFRILADRKKYESAETKEKYTKIVEKAYQNVEALMKKYGGENRSPMPPSGKVHLVGLYEFMANRGFVEAAGICIVEEGEIFINMNMLETLEPDALEDSLLHTISHEVIHDSVANNYWGFETEDKEQKTYTSRRTGLRLTRYIGRNANMPDLKERGRALNEAVTEDLALEAYREAGGTLDFSNRAYGPERRVLKALQEKFKIDFKLFAEAVVNRRKLPELVKAMAKANKKIDSGYMSMLLAVMDYENGRPQCRNTYPQTLAFIRGTQVNLDSEIHDYLGAKFLNKDGTIKKSVQEKYNLRVLERPKMAA